TEDDAPLSSIVDRERAHPDEQLLDVIRILLVESKDDLRVAPRPEPNALGFELRAERRRVVDLAVVDDGDRLVVVRHGLVAVLDVDDRKARHADVRIRMRDDTTPVRAAMADPLAHAGDPLARLRGRRLERGDPDGSSPWTCYR